MVSNPIRFRWRLIGTNIVDYMGRDSTGKWFADIYDDHWLAIHTTAYMASVTRREPVFYRGNLEYVGKDHRFFRSVHLPLAADGETVDMLLLCLDFS